MNLPPEAESELEILGPGEAEEERLAKKLYANDMVYCFPNENRPESYDSAKDEARSTTAFGCIESKLGPKCSAKVHELEGSDNYHNCICDHYKKFTDLDFVSFVF